MNKFKIAIIFFSLIALSACKTSQKKSAQLQQQEQIKEGELSSKEAIDFDYLYLDAVREKILGNYMAALNKFGQAMRINPRNAAVHYEMSTLYLYTGNIERAIVSGEFAVKYDNKNKWYKISLAELYMQADKADKALQIYNQLLKEEPNNPDYIYNIASIFTAQKKFEDAAKMLDRLEQIMGINPETIEQKKNLYLRMNKVDKAIKEVEKLIASNPGEANYLGLLADIYVANGMEEKAVDIFKKIIEIDSSNAQVYFSLAEFYREKKDFDQSYIYLKKAFQNPYAPIDSKVGVLLSFYDLSERNEALKKQGFELCQILIETHPDDAKSYSIFGDFLIREKRYEEALQAFNKVLELDKSRFAIWNQVILLESELNNTERVYQLSKDAAELFPLQPVFFLYGGIAALQLKKYQECVDLIKEGLAVAIGNPPMRAQMHATLGDAYHALKKYKESDENYEKALKIDPNNTYVLNNYAYYLSLRKEKLDQARKMAEKANALEPNNSSYLDTYAWILFQSGEFDEALGWIEKAIQHGGSSNAVIMEHKGDIYFKLGKVEEALDWWKKALAKDEKNEMLKRKIKDKKYYEEAQ